MGNEDQDDSLILSSSLDSPSTRTVSGYASSNKLDCSRKACEVGRYGMVVVMVVVVVVAVCLRYGAQDSIVDNHLISYIDRNEIVLWCSCSCSCS